MKFLPVLKKTIHALELGKSDFPSRKEGTQLISDAIIQLCLENNISFETEVYLGVRRKDGKRGIIDFVIHYHDKTYVIEIDSSNKKWSLEKLVLLEQKGYEAVWIRWNSPMKLSVPSNIHLLNFTRNAPTSRKPRLAK